MGLRMNEEIERLNELSDAELTQLAFIPWRYSSSANDYAGTDADGVSIAIDTEKEPLDREALQSLCWEKFQENPQINTNIRSLMGRLAGMGFEISSDINMIQEVIEEIELDWRNRLYNFYPKYVGRSYVEGELFLCLTCHTDGFIEVDYIDPAVISGGSKGDGIIMHPEKDTLPLAYFIESGNQDPIIIPSIYVAYEPKLLQQAEKDQDFKIALVPKSGKSAFSSLSGCYKFMVAWEKGLITRRNASYLRTVLAWLNNYETLKKYEIDFKKSVGAYLWVVTIEDPKAFRLWLNLSDEDKRKTGIGAKKTPGGTLVLPPGMDIKVINPNLPNISESDTDILHMVTSGLNEPEDITTGQARGTFATVKMSRGPMSDRIADEVAYWERFLRYDFWKPVFYLKSIIGKFPRTFGVREATGFKGNEPTFKTVKKRPEQCLEIAFPTTEMLDPEVRARAFLGVKHGSVYDTMGIPYKDVAEKMGFGNYRKLRLRHATEQDKYPELIPTVDQESYQEKREAEPGTKPTGPVKRGRPSKQKQTMDDDEV